MLKLRVSLFLAALAIPALPLLSQLTALSPVSDAYVRGGEYSENNYGSETTLVVKQGNVQDFFRRSCLTFPVASLEQNKIDSAVLSLFVKKVSGKMKVEVFESSANWNENSITWSNAPSSGRIMGDAEVSISGQYLDINITSGFLSGLNKGTALGISLFDTTAFNQQAVFNSREAADNRPVINIYYGNGPTPPSPADLSAEATDTLAIKLSWQDRSFNELGFIIERKTEGLPFAVIDTASYNQTEYRDDELEEGQTYTYRVFALGFYEVSEGSEEASARTPDLPESPPLAPADLGGEAISTGQINLNWTDQSDDETFFVLERKEEGKAYLVRDTLPPNSTNYQDYGLTPSGIYSYRIYASNGYFDSAPSSEVTLQTGDMGWKYYVDAVHGSDNNPGIHPDSAWRTLEMLNSRIFSPGDSLFIARGSVWTGRLSPGGSGMENFPIVLSVFGEGDRPLINGGGMEGEGVLYLYNQSYWHISGLEITNDAPEEGLRRGVEIAAENAGVIRQIYLNDLHVHHIKGTVGNDYEVAKKTGGIFFMVKENREVPTRFDDIRIENCLIHHCDNQGIVTFNEILAYPGTAEWMPRRITNMAIRHNTIHHISKNAMILRMMDGGVVEYNLCYTTATGTTGNTIFTRSSRNVICQFNEGYDNQSPDYDGSLYDADLESPGCIFQYSFSHDNAHGLYWQCTVQQDTGIIVRYNISQNDKGRIFNFSYPSNGTDVYNNTIFIGPHRSPVIIGEKTNYGGKRNYRFRNNLIINMSQTASYDWVDESFIGEREFSHNLLYGYQPSGGFNDPEMITEDPLLTDPGNAAGGLESAHVYKPLPGSPVKDAGTKINNNGGRDYEGNLLTDGKPDIGAFELQYPVYSVPGTPDSDSDGYYESLQIRPNPLSDRVEISFRLDKGEYLSVTIYDSLGRTVSSLADRFFEAGTHTLTWEGRGTGGETLSNGLYICNLISREADRPLAMSRAIILNRH